MQDRTELRRYMEAAQQYETRKQRPAAWVVGMAISIGFVAVVAAWGAIMGGSKMTEEKEVHVSLRVPEELHRQMKIKAAESGKNLHDVYLQAVQEATK